MALLSKIDSNVTGLAIAREQSNGVLPAAPIWIAMQPNEYPGNFGGELSLTARTPISQLRQNRKGVVTDLNAAGSFGQDMTMYSFQPLWPGLFLANRRDKPQAGGRLSATSVESVTAAAGTAIFDLGEPAGFPAGLGFVEGMLVHTEGFGQAGNNSGENVFRVTNVNGDTVSVQGGTVEANPPADAIIRSVGFQFDASDAAITRSGGNFPTLTFSAQDNGALPLIAGETIFLDGVTEANRFNSVGAARVRARVRVAPPTNGASSLTFDQTSGGADGETEMVADAGTGKTIQIFWADVTNNVAADDALFNQVTYTLLRTLGRPDDADGITQGESVNGSLWNNATVTIPTGNKVTIAAEFLSTNNQNFAGTAQDPLPVVLDAIQDLPESAAFNTTNDIPDIRLYERSTDPAAVVPQRFFRFISELTMNISNNATANKAVGVLGAFAVTAGNFTSTSDMTGYFQRVGALEAIRNNADVGMFAFAEQTFGGRRGGLLFDLPFGSISTPGLNVTGDAPITAPLTLTSAVDPDFNHTMIVHEYWFLPS